MSSAPHLHVVPDPQTAPVPPQNLEAEENVLGAMMMSEHALATVLEILRPADFYRESHGAIFHAAGVLFAEGKPVDAIILTDALEASGRLESVGGRVRVHELAYLVPATANAGHYARIVKDKATLRSGLAAGEQTVRDFREQVAPTPELVDRAQQRFYNISAGDTSHDPEPLYVAMEETYQTLVEFSESGRELVGLSTGFRALDNLTAGFQPGNLVIVAGRPGMGKSALAHKFCARLSVAYDIPTLLFTLEMSKAEVAHRLWAMEARVGGQRIRAGKLSCDEWGRVQDVMAKVKTAPLYIDDSGALHPMEIRSKARRVKTRVPNLGLVVVDYLQLMSAGANIENRVQEVSHITRQLKVLARDLDVPVVALSQLSRGVESRVDKRPMLQDLRESGSIEQDADLVMFLYREDYYSKVIPKDGKSVAELILAKQRNGPTDTVMVQFERDYARFAELGA